METTLDHPDKFAQGPFNSARAPTQSRWRRANGTALSGLAIAFLLFDSSSSS